MRFRKLTLPKKLSFDYLSFLYRWLHTRCTALLGKRFCSHWWFRLYPLVFKYSTSSLGQHVSLFIHIDSNMGWDIFVQNIYSIFTFQSFKQFHVCNRQSIVFNPPITFPRPRPHYNTFNQILGIGKYNQLWNFKFYRHLNCTNGGINLCTVVCSITNNRLRQILSVAKPKNNSDTRYGPLFSISNTRSISKNVNISFIILSKRYSIIVDKCRWLLGCIFAALSVCRYKFFRLLQGGKFFVNRASTTINVVFAIGPKQNKKNKSLSSRLIKFCVLLATWKTHPDHYFPSQRRKRQT